MNTTNSAKQRENMGVGTNGGVSANASSMVDTLNSFTVNAATGVRKVAVVGLGYVGLPVAIAFARKQASCIGFDIDYHKIFKLKRAIDEVCGIEEACFKEIANNILFTSNEQDLAHADFYIIAVPTPVDEAHKPDLQAVISASKIVARYLKKGDIVVYESTVYPGVTEEICLPLLEAGDGVVSASSQRLKCGVDFAIGYSPERINPGDKEREFTNIKKIVSGCNEAALDIIAKTYEQVVTAGVYRATSIKVAEAAKVIENTQRDLNIALMNELAIIFARMGLSTIDILEAAGSKWNFLPFRPGLVGGHCIGVDPYYLTYKAELLGYIPQVILAGRRINDNMGRYVARRAIKRLIKDGCSMQGLQAIVYGITFKENCNDVRNSKVIDVVRELVDYNVEVFVHDPLASSELTAKEYGIRLSAYESLPQAALAIVAVAHDEFKSVSGVASIIAKLQSSALIFDVKSILPHQHLADLGFGVEVL